MDVDRDNSLLIGDAGSVPRIIWLPEQLSAPQSLGHSEHGFGICVVNGLTASDFIGEENNDETLKASRDRKLSGVCFFASAFVTAL